ncbi:MAG: hypothetical protein ACXWVJ_02280 [Caulobacteraceae bacterium]
MAGEQRAHPISTVKDTLNDKENELIAKYPYAVIVDSCNRHGEVAMPASEFDSAEAIVELEEADLCAVSGGLKALWMDEPGP